MKTRTWLAVGILAVSLAKLQPASALELTIGPFGSYFDADEAGDAWGGGVMTRLGIFDWLAVDARASYLDLSDTDISMIPLEAAATFRLPLMDKRFIPYAGAGVGYYLYEDDSDLIDIEDDVGFFPVVGLELRFGSNHQWALFGEARWLFLSSDIDAAEDELGDLDDDDIDGLAVNVGLLFRF
jgi:hypothetical protein